MPKLAINDNEYKLTSFEHANFENNHELISSNGSEWIVPCNPTVYDLETAMQKLKYMYWRKNANYSGECF